MKTLLLALSLLFSVYAMAADTYEALQVGNDVYRRVVVLSASESSLSIRHARGIAQVPIARLSPELQSRYGFDSLRAAERNAELEQQRKQQAVAQRRRIERAKAERSNLSNRRGPANSAFSLFGTKPTLKSEVDLRTRFRSHGIRIRSQSGPSCSVHAVLAAIEYQYAEGQGRVLNLSEPFLVEATCRSLGRSDDPAINSKSGFPSGWDAGFALEQVFQAIRGHGLALERSGEARAAGEPYSKLDTVDFSPFMVPGGRTRKGIENIVHVLNANMPVVVGVSWPAYSRIAHTSVLGKQPARAGAGHAVTIIGYRCEDGNVENAKFIFRNSWGDDWGAGGYGFFTYEYLLNNLGSCYVLELK